MSDFNSFNLLPSILEEIKHKGYTEPTPIQEQAIPPLMEGKNLLGIAQTGTGKTAAFSLPIIHRLASNPVKIKPFGVRALILAPTRELATQVENNIQQYSKGLDFKTKVVIGGVGKRPQLEALEAGLDVLIATPGRLLDIIEDGQINFDQLEVFVLDEADTMLDLGFLNNVKWIVHQLPLDKQTLLFSATMPKDIQKLADNMLIDPVTAKVAEEARAVDLIEQQIHFLKKANKLQALVNIIKGKSVEAVLIFAKTKFGADILVEDLAKAEISASAIHSNRTQGQRERAITEFRNGELKVLVATDIAARGIDVSHVTHVINYNLPEDPRNYIHRIGRTARAGRDGVAISLCVQNDLLLIKNIEKVIDQKIPVFKDHSFHHEFSQALQKTRAQKMKGFNGKRKGGRY